MSHEHASLTLYLLLWHLNFPCASFASWYPLLMCAHTRFSRFSAVRACVAAAVACGGRRRRRRRAVVQRTRVRAQKLRGLRVLCDRQRQRLIDSADCDIGIRTKAQKSGGHLIFDWMPTCLICSFTSIVSSSHMYRFFSILPVFVGVIHIFTSTKKYIHTE